MTDDKLPEPEVMCDCGGNYYTAEQMLECRCNALEEAANLSPNGLEITAAAMPHEVWTKYRDAIRALASRL